MDTHVNCPAKRPTFCDGCSRSWKWATLGCLESTRWMSLNPVTRELLEYFKRQLKNWVNETRNAMSAAGVEVSTLPKDESIDLQDAHTAGGAALCARGWRTAVAETEMMLRAANSSYVKARLTYLAGPGGTGKSTSFMRHISCAYRGFGRPATGRWIVCLGSLHHRSMIYPLELLFIPSAYD